ncbi:MAG: hypothetical protein FD144_989 [Rhodospirillaceae bacterium]|nr:MAG: hypothetical protein FD144_989 [Rhodospirillaceae bacterium]
MTLFDEWGAGLHPVYERLRDADDAGDVEQKMYLDGLWRRAQGHLDSHFKSAFAHQIHQRFWELRLTAALLDLGYSLEPGADGRPDFATKLPGGERLWIEAVSPSLGSAANPDRPADLIPNGGFRATPVEQLLMRYTQALQEKRDRFQNYREAGVVAEGDRCIIAVNSGGLWPYVEGVGLPRILSAVFPIGEEQITIDLTSGSTLSVEYPLRGEVVRANGAPISLTAFLHPSYACISGLISDSARVTGWRQQGNARFVSAANPTATVPLPQACFRLGAEYHYVQDAEGFSLQRVEHQLEGVPTPA